MDRLTSRSPDIDVLAPIIPDDDDAMFGALLFRSERRLAFALCPDHQQGEGQGSKTEDHEGP